MKVYTTVDWGVKIKLRKLKQRFMYCIIHEDDSDFQRVVDFYIGQITVLMDEIADCGYITTHPVWLGSSLHKMSWGRTLKERWKNFLDFIGFRPHKFTVGEPEWLD